MRRRRRDKYLQKLLKKARRGYRGEPVASISYYGPDDTQATKVAVGIVYHGARGVHEMERWYSETSDVRHDPAINEAIFRFVEQHEARSVVRLTEINGCPHEEGIDFPQGESCPQCPFWAGRERLTDRLQRYLEAQKEPDEEE